MMKRIFPFTEKKLWVCLELKWIAKACSKARMCEGGKDYVHGYAYEGFRARPWNYLC